MPAFSWPRTRLTDMLSLDVPIVLGPFGGGLSSVELASLVSEAGGLGSFGAQHLAPGQIAEVIAALRERTRRSFAVNLWVSNHDLPEAELARERFDAAVERLRPFYAELGVEAPPFPERFAWTFEEQLEPILAEAPPVLSFVYGVPSSAALEACRERGIATVGTALTLAEAVALDEAGVDAVVATGFEAGGHRVAFLGEAEDSLIGSLALIPAVADAVSVPVIAAGGIADARGVAAALTLGAEAVQIGTAFLATEESVAMPEHKALLLADGVAHTRLTRVFSGRLARGIVNRAMDELGPEFLPFPYQAYLTRPLSAAAREQGRADSSALWAGQGTGLVRHRRAAELFDALVSGVSALR
jgi:nitronate monooxygenase